VAKPGKINGVAPVVGFPHAPQRAVWTRCYPLEAKPVALGCIQQPLRGGQLSAVIAVPSMIRPIGVRRLVFIWFVGHQAQKL
jgi:hypothetical protein